MSKRKYTVLICDKCGDEIENGHYEVILREWSDINCKYLKPKVAHLCNNHQAEIITLGELINPVVKSDE